MILRITRRKRSTSVTFHSRKVPGFFFGEALPFVFGGIVNAMAKLLGQEGCELAPPHLPAVGREFDGPAQIHKHGIRKTTLRWRTMKRMERPRGLEPPPGAWQAPVLPLYYGRTER